MGWSGGTSIFNAVYKELEELQKRDELDYYNAKSIIKVLIQELWNEDWDTEGDSAYFSSDNQLVMDAIYELDPILWDSYMDMQAESLEYSDDQLAERRAEQRAEDWMTGFDRGDY